MTSIPFWPQRGLRGCAFPPGTRVTAGGQAHECDELWLLMDPEEEKENDWNYWVVIECPNEGPWWIRRVMPHWGQYRPKGPICHIGQPFPDQAYEVPPSFALDPPYQAYNVPPSPTPPPDEPPYQSRASSSWE